MRCRPTVGPRNRHGLAVKVLRRNNPATDSEVEMLRLCQGHPAIVRLHEVLHDAQYTYIVTELLEGGELNTRAGLHGFSDSELEQVARQLVDGLMHMHSRGVAHRDLKPENVVFLRSDSTELRIVDFGFAKRITDAPGMRRLEYTLDYAAPEMLDQRDDRTVTAACDLWSLGATLYRVMCNERPYGDGDNVQRRIRDGLFNKRLRSWQTLMPKWQRAITGLMTINVEPRRKTVAGLRTDLVDVILPWNVDVVAERLTSVAVTSGKESPVTVVLEEEEVEDEKPVLHTADAEDIASAELVLDNKTTQLDSYSRLSMVNNVGDVYKYDIEDGNIDEEHDADEKNILANATTPLTNHSEEHLEFELEVEINCRLDDDCSINDGINNLKVECRNEIATPLNNNEKCVEDAEIIANAAETVASVSDRHWAEPLIEINSNINRHSEDYQGINDAYASCSDAEDNTEGDFSGFSPAELDSTTSNQTKRLQSAHHRLMGCHQQRCLLDIVCAFQPIRAQIFRHTPGLIPQSALPCLVSTGVGPIPSRQRRGTGRPIIGYDSKAIPLKRNTSGLSLKRRRSQIESIAIGSSSTMMLPPPAPPPRKQAKKTQHTSNRDHYLPQQPLLVFKSKPKWRPPTPKNDDSIDAEFDDDATSSKRRSIRAKPRIDYNENFANLPSSNALRRKTKMQKRRGEIS